MRRERVLKRQSIWDIAAQFYGAPEGIAFLIEDNPDVFNLETTPVPGTSFFVRDQVIDKKTVEYFAARDIKPATAVEVVFQPSNWILTTGYWDITGFWFTNAFWNINP